MAGSYTSIELDGQPYKLRYDWDAMCELREKGIGTEDIPELENDPRTIRTLLWVGLMHHHPELTERDVARLFMPRDVDYIVERFGAAMRQAMPEGVADEGDPTRKTKRGRKPSQKRKEPPSESSD
jgi:hypothetical protein